MSPPICEVIFSSTGVVIVLDPLAPLRKPTGLALGGVGRLSLVWDRYPGAICYTVYKINDNLDPFGQYEIIAECIPDPELPLNRPRGGCYRVSAITLEGESELSDPFCVEQDPAVETDPADDVQSTSAILNGVINPSGVNAFAYFQYGLDLAYGSQTAPQPMGDGTSDIPFDDLVEGLTPGTEYHFRAVASNDTWTIFGADEVFVTPGGGGGQTVTVVATTPDAFEIGEVPGAFTIFRTGDTSNPVTVEFTLGGTAVEGVDYDPVGTSVLMGAGVTQVQVIITPIDNFVIGPDLSVILTLVGTVNYTVGVPGDATVTIHQAAADAPCSLFTEDDTSFGQRTLPVTAGVVNWNALPLGNYQWVLIDHVYQFTINDCPSGCEATYGITGPNLDWATSLGDSGSFPSTSLLNEACCGGGLTGFSSLSEATAVADYLTKTLPNFENFEFNGTTVDASLTTTGVAPPAQPTSPQPVFDLQRILKLTVDQPDTLAIENLATFADGRFIASYNGSDSAPIALNASAAAVQVALNLMPSIIADGGVTCAGTLAAGMTVTWNVNGARALFTLAISTISLGYAAEAVETTPGSGGAPEVQTFTVAPYCSLSDLNSVSPDWNGETILRDLGLAQWKEAAVVEPAGTFQVNGFDFAQMVVALTVGPEAPTTAATASDGGAGNIDAGSHSWRVAFVQLFGESGGSPVSNVLVLGVASQVDLTNIPLGPAGTTARRIYRTLAGGGKYYLVDTINNNSATTYTDNLSDADLFNGGSVTLMRPASCFWACSVQSYQLGFFNGTLWCGYKLTGLTPEGTYQYSESDFVGSGSLCPLAVNGTLQNITLAGTF